MRILKSFAAKGSVSGVRRVGGAQAEGARSLGLVKIDRPSAKRLWAKGTPIVIVGSNVGPFHFFGGWHLAHTVDPSDPRYEGTTFDVYANQFGSYLEPELGRHPAFFVKASDLK